MKKIIVSDLDGTLLRSDKTYNHELIPLIKQLAKQDIYFCLASGRPVNNLKNIFNEISDIIYYVADNGASVEANNEIVFSSIIDKANAKKILEIGYKHSDTVMVVCSVNKAYIYHAKNPSILKEVYHYYPKTILSEDIEEALSSPIIKVSFWNDIDSEIVYNRFSSFKDNYNVVTAGKHWLDIMNKGVNKEEGVKHLQKILDIDTEDVYVFGDYTNDLELFNYPKSFASSNACEIIKSKASEIILSNDEDAVFHKVKELFF